MSGCTHFAVAHLQLLSWKVEPVFDDDDVSVDTREEIRMPQVASKETNEMSWCLNLLSSSAHVCVYPYALQVPRVHLCDLIVAIGDDLPWERDLWLFEVFSGQRELTSEYSDQAA